MSKPMRKPDSTVSRQTLWQRKHRAMGLCSLCSRSVFKGSRCKEHYERHKLAARMRYIPKVRGRYNVDAPSPLALAAKRAAAKAAAKRMAATRARRVRSIVKAKKRARAR